MRQPTTLAHTCLAGVMGAVVRMVRMMVTVVVVMGGSKGGRCSQDHRNDEQRQELFHGRIIAGGLPRAIR